MFGNDRMNRLGFIKQLWGRASELITPPLNSCIYCGKGRSEGAKYLHLCRECHAAIPWIREVKCPTCGRYEVCYDCSRRKNTHFVSSRSAVQYDARMKDLLARYKYRGDERLKDVFVGMSTHAYERLIQDNQQLKQGHCITYIPLSQERLEERGFNQAEQLAEGLGSQYKVPVIPLLIRTRHTDKQSYKTRDQRLADLENVFALDQEEVDRLKLQGPVPETLGSIVIIDDVYTTGSTLNQCASILSKQLATSVYGITWAR